jgi:hypothetical protein
MPTPTNPLNRNFKEEGTRTNQDLIDLNESIRNNYAKFSPYYGAADMENYVDLLTKLGTSNNSLTGFANTQTTSGNTALRAGNVADAESLGQGALNTLRNLNPDQYEALRFAQQQARATGSAAPNQYEASLGARFNAGPQYDRIGNISNVGVGQNPLLNYANYQASTAGYSPLGGDLQQMARDQLALGSGLSQAQSRDATQAAREGWAARGLINSPGAVAEEVLNRDRYGQQLLQQRQAFANQANQLGMSQQGQNNQFTLGTLGANATQGAQGLQAALANQGMNYQTQAQNQQAGMNALRQNQDFGLSLANMGYNRQDQGTDTAFRNAQLQSSAAFNPFQTITNANTQNQGMNKQLFDQGTGFSSGALSNQYAQNMVNPFNPYAQDVYNSNFNADNARFISAGNNAAARAGAQDAASGQIARSFLDLIGRSYQPPASGAPRTGIG